MYSGCTTILHPGCPTFTSFTVQHDKEEELPSNLSHPPSDIVDGHSAVLYPAQMLPFQSSCTCHHRQRQHRLVASRARRRPCRVCFKTSGESFLFLVAMHLLLVAMLLKPLGKLEASIFFQGAYTSLVLFHWMSRQGCPLTGQWSASVP